MELPSGFNGTLKEHHQQLLHGVQRLANVIITVPNTPSVALDVIAGSIHHLRSLQYDSLAIIDEKLI